MNDNQTQKADIPPVPPEQSAYANVLGPARYVALVMLAATFAIYVLGIRAARIPCRDVPRYWSMSSKDLLHALQLEPGWAWLNHAMASDFMNNLGICLLASISALAYIRVLPIFAARRHWPMICIVIGEILIMALAASGWINGGH